MFVYGNIPKFGVYFLVVYIIVNDDDAKKQDALFLNEALLNMAVYRVDH